MEIFGPYLRIVVTMASTPPLWLQQHKGLLRMATKVTSNATANTWPCEGPALQVSKKQRAKWQRTFDAPNRLPFAFRFHLGHARLLRITQNRNLRRPPVSSATRRASPANRANWGIQESVEDSWAGEK